MLFYLLEMPGFRKRLRSSIKFRVSTARFSVLVNGPPAGLLVVVVV